MKRFLILAIALAAVGVTDYFVGEWYDYGPSGKLYFGGYRWFGRLISLAMFYPGMILTKAGIFFKMDAASHRAMVSAVWTVSTSATAFGGWRLLRWWSAARRRKMASPPL